MADITMPQLGETVTEGTITKWFKKVGDHIDEDEVLFEVSTDKVDSEVPSPVAGTVTEILVGEGDTVDVGVKLAVVSEGGGAAAATDGAAPAQADTKQETPAPEQAAQPEPAAPAPAPAPAPEAPAAPTPQAPPAPAPAPGPSEAAPAASASSGAAKSSNGKLLSPVVRRLIAENNLDPSQIEGTGAGGRITRNDVLHVIESGAGAPAAAAAAPQPASPAAPTGPAPAAPSAPSRPSVPTPPAITVTPGQRDTVIPHTRIRRLTAEHMTMSKHTSAHVYASIEVDYEPVERVRRANRNQWKAEEGFSLTYLPFITRAIVDAIRQFPEINSTFTEDELIVHHYVNVGVAVDMDFKGLIVPVIHDADGKRLRAIAREVSDLAGRARAKKLSAEEISGGTITITNPGPFGTTMTLPVINQPQIAIISTDAVKRRPVVVELPDGSESIAIHSVGNLTLTWDHRAVDGAYAAAFLAKVKEILETRDWASEL